ncbi:MAG: hypothetical protein JST84_04095 [Acidobacteria bacterium]|nr:hypothetical protein [Acidobacteriota bacterium]
MNVIRCEVVPKELHFRLIMIRLTYSIFRVCLLAAVWCLSLHAQNEDATSSPPAPSVTSTTEKVGRWLELSKFGFAARYMHVANSAPITTVTQVQQRFDLTGRFKFDARGKVTLNAWINSGRRFTAGWDETPAGPRRGNVNLYLKHLFLSVQPVKGVEVQYGGFDFLRGQHTEITTYNNDGYLTGQRLILRRPKELFFDEIAATYGYFGDLNLPNLNKRYHRLKQANYHQFLVSKTLGKRAAMSFDYTFVSGAETLRQALKINAKETRIVDAVRFENYQRVDVNRAYGFALLGEKAVTKKLSVTYGYTQIDRAYGNVNADKVFTGKHLYLLGSYALTPTLTFQLYHGHLLEKPSVMLPVRTRTEIVLRYNFLKTLQEHGWFK